MRIVMLSSILLSFFLMKSISYANEEVLLVTRSDCLLLTRHTPDANVKYKDAVDVRGRKVVPANAQNNDRLNFNEKGFSFYLTHDAAKNNIVDSTGIDAINEGKIILGQVTVKDGDVFWNGTSLKEADKERIFLLCNEDQLKKRRPIRKR